MYVLPAALDYVVKLRPARSSGTSASSTVPVYEARIEISGHFDAERVRPACRRRRPATSTGTRPRCSSPSATRAAFAELSAVDVAFAAGDFHPASGLGFDGLARAVPAGRAGAPGPTSLQRLARRGRQSRLQRAAARRTHDGGARARAGPTRASPTPSCPPRSASAATASTHSGRSSKSIEPSARHGFSMHRYRRLSPQSAFGVNLYQPVDAYQRVERAVKYAGLFVAFTFMAFFCWRARAPPAHPSGAVRARRPGAQRASTCLLLALSEHLPFAAAYLIATAALAGLLGDYVGGALRSRRQGAGVAASFALMYAAAVRAAAVGGLRAARRRARRLRHAGGDHAADAARRLVHDGADRQPLNAADRAQRTR